MIKYIPLLAFKNRRDKSFGMPSEEFAEREYKLLRESKAYNAERDVIMIYKEIRSLNEKEK